MTKRLVLILFMLAAVTGLQAAGEQDEARRIFEKAYNQVFGSQGCSMHYDVNLVGVYKTEGTIWYKGKKSKFTDNRVDCWNDGVTVFTVFRKKKVIEVYDSTKGNHDKYAGKFKFSVDDFSYSMEHLQTGILLTMKQKRGAKGTVKQAKVFLDADTYAPKHVKVKVAMFWANIHISNFKAGNISDDIFIFPRSHYGSNYSYVDKR